MGMMGGGFPFRWYAAAGALAALLCLSGCGGGASVGSDSQEPDPVVQDYPVAYVKRPLPLNNQGQPTQSDLRRQIRFNAGGDLYLRERATPGAAERNITGAVTGGRGDVRDVEVSYDGTKLLFALRLPLIENADEDEQPTWNIWEYDIPSDRLRRVIASDIEAEAGHDIAPHYLPDGRIVFSSTRQRQARAVLLDEGKPQFANQTEDLGEDAFTLHVMDADGSDIRQITFNQSHDLYPTVLSSGEVLFTRWQRAGGRDGMHLYRVRTDGTALELYYGARSHDTGRTADGRDNATVQFVRPKQMPDGRIAALVMPYTGTYGGGDIVLIDAERYADNTQPIYQYLGLTGPAQTPATAEPIYAAPGISPGGRFASFYPLWDGTDRLLVSWTPCRLIESERIVPCTEEALQNPAARAAPPLYGVWMRDLRANTQQPVVAPQEGVMFTDLVAAKPRPLPTLLHDQAPGAGLNPDWVADGVGVLHIRSVYDVDGVDTAPGGIAAVRDPARTPAADRPARFLRILKAVSIPDRDVREVPSTAYGASRSQLMREIIGYAPIEPDGSVMVKVPANVPLAIEVLDERGRRISARHQGWLQVQAGETVTCNGCHTPGNAQPHGRQDGRPPLNAGAPVTGQPFPNTNPLLFADYGETMAEARARLYTSLCLTDPPAELALFCLSPALTPSVDLYFDDLWVDPAANPAPSFSYRYADLATPAPASVACQSRWHGGCRTVIHYPTHIHPLWSRDRRVLDDDGVTVLADRTCTACHNRVDAMGAVQVPAAQLDLSDGLSLDEPDHLNSYRELLFPDNEQEIVEGALQDRLVPAVDADGNPIYQTDANGNPLQDENGQLIPVMVPVRAPGPSMSPNGARAGYFLSKFEPGGSHEGWLTPAELRLIAEWLDIGAQYYNDPFAVPAD